MYPYRSPPSTAIPPCRDQNVAHSRKEESRGRWNGTHVGHDACLW